MLKEIEAVLALELNSWKRNFSCKNVEKYDRIFALNEFGVTDKVKELVRLARIGYEHSTSST